MSTAYAWLAFAAALAAAVGSVPYVAHALHALAPYLLAGLWAYALWLARRANARRYHRHGRPDVHRHAKPTRRRRLALYLRHVRSVRLRATDVPETGLATVALPDIRSYARHA